MTMSADTPRRTRSQPSSNSGPVTVTPQQVNDRSIIDSVAGFINEVVPAAYSTPTDTKDQLQWVHFEYFDRNQFAYSDSADSENAIPAPLVIALGYGSGVQVWAVPINGDATEVLSWRHGSVRVLRILPNPSCSSFSDNIDLYSDKRPLMVLCDTATPGPQYFSLSFISLKTGDQVKNIKFKNPVLDVLANKRSVVVTFAERIAIFDAYTLEDRLTVTTCYLSPGLCPNPVALGTRWLAYAEKKLSPIRRSGGGNEGEGVQSYAATVLHAAKSLGKGLRELGETVASSLSGTSGGTSTQHIPPVAATELVHPGVITILDLQNTDSTDRGLPAESVVAHFTAHSEAIVCLQFDPSGMLLVTADKRGHDFHLFRIQPHPGGPSLTAVHHLYTLHRGDTSARVQDMCFSPDSRWVAVSTLRGTTHVFPVTPYGGPVGMRTHATPHVVNRMSRFHRSAGLPVEGRSNSPVSQLEIPIQSGIPYRNPRLPPYPHHTVVHPLAQLRQTLTLPMSGAGLTQRSSSGRSRLGSSSDESAHVALRVAACFAAPRAWLDQTRDVTSHSKQRRPVESLFVISSHGTLIQYDLEPRHSTNIPKERVCDDTAVELKVNAKAQWTLQRASASSDIQAPLQPDNLLFCTVDGECEPRIAKRDYTDDRWLSQVEIVTHAGPHRRLWMGPQFTFKMYNGNNGSPVSVLETEAIEVSSPHKPARSKPLNMPDDGIPVLIESGSASSFEQSPRLLDREMPGSCGETQLKEDLADAMLESPGRARADNGGGRCVLVSVQHNAHIVAKVVNPLGTVVTLPSEPSPPPYHQISDPVDEAVIHENCDESLFRPVVAPRHTQTIEYIKPESHQNKTVTIIHDSSSKLNKIAQKSVKKNEHLEQNTRDSSCFANVYQKTVAKSDKIHHQIEQNIHDSSYEHYTNTKSDKFEQNTRATACYSNTAQTKVTKSEALNEHFEQNTHDSDKVNARFEANTSDTSLEHYSNITQTKAAKVEWPDPNLCFGNYAKKNLSKLDHSSHNSPFKLNDSFEPNMRDNTKAAQTISKKTNESNERFKPATREFSYAKVTQNSVAKSDRLNEIFAHSTSDEKFQENTDQKTDRSCERYQGLQYNEIVHNDSENKPKKNKKKTKLGIRVTNPPEHIIKPPKPPLSELEPEMDITASGQPEPEIEITASDPPEEMWSSMDDTHTENYVQSIEVESYDVEEISTLLDALLNPDEEMVFDKQEDDANVNNNGSETTESDDSAKKLAVSVETAEYAEDDGICLPVVATQPVQKASKRKAKKKRK